MGSTILRMMVDITAALHEDDVSKMLGQQWNILQRANGVQVLSPKGRGIQIPFHVEDLMEYMKEGYIAALDDGHFLTEPALEWRIKKLV